jgi:excisionase family DNA binding protein
MPSRRKSLISVSAAAEELGVSLSTVWRMIRRGELLTVRVGRRRFLTTSALSEKRVSPPAQRLKPFGSDHPMWHLIGAFRSGGAGPGSGDKYAILYDDEASRTVGRERDPGPTRRRRRSS